MDNFEVEGSDGPMFLKWKAAVDEEIKAALGVPSEDIKDVGWRDMYDQGVSPSTPS